MLMSLVLSSLAALVIRVPVPPTCPLSLPSSWQMGSRFVATREAGCHQKFKEKVITSQASSQPVIQAYHTLNTVHVLPA